MNYLKPLQYSLIAGTVIVSSALAAKAAENSTIAIPSQEAVASAPIVEVTSKVPWAKAPIRIDGKLTDWPEKTPAVVMEGKDHVAWSRGTYQGTKDLSVAVRLCRDDNNIYVAAEILDDNASLPDRISVAFADVKSKLITGWRDVGERIGDDDLYVIFTLDKKDNVGMYWAHVQERMDHSVTQNSFGSESERLALLEQNHENETYKSKIFAKASHQEKNGGTVTVFEASFPWKTLAPYDPVSYAPIKMNIAVQDQDGEGANSSSGWAAWTAGLAGVYSGVHFPTLTFTPPVGRNGVDTFAQVPDFNYINSNIQANFSFFNHGAERKAQLQLFDSESEQAVITTAVTLPTGFSQKKLVINSEKIAPGQRKLIGKLTLDGQTPITIPVDAPTFDNTITVHSLAEYQEKIVVLEEHVAVLEKLYEKIKAKGLDTSYPLAYLTLQKMFVPSSKEQLKKGDTARVQRNLETLDAVYKSSKAYMEGVLENPKTQLTLPPAFKPDQLKVKSGYFFDGDRPVFLWGPVVFWYLRDEQQQVIDLGFNSVTPEVPHDLSNPEVIEHLQTWYKAGVAINAHPGAPGLALTGADANKSKLLQEHPDLKNLDPNNFLPFIVQMPVVKDVIRESYKKEIDFWRDFRGVVSYWLWNEPWYTNYSERTRQDFIARYLKPCYKTIAALNQRWKSDYKSFDEIQLIEWPDPKNYAPWYDFQQYRDIVLADFFSYLSETVEKFDPTRPHGTKFMAASLHSFDIAQLQQSDTINGFDGSYSDRDIVFLDYDRSVYPDRPLVNTEIHIAYAGIKSVEMVAWRLALHGMANGSWWCWHSNPGFSDSIKNAESMYALSISGLDVQRLFYPYIYALNNKTPQIATLFPDVVERRSDLSMPRIRFELATAQYALGLQPFYAIESRIAKRELSRQKVLLAGESDYVKDSTYQGVIEYVRNGGIVIVTKGGFGHNEYGDPRDTSALIKLEGGEAYGEHARIYPLGKGKVVCIDAIGDESDVVLNGGQALQGGPTLKNQQRRRIYQQVLAKVMADNGLEDDVRIVSANDSNPDALYGIDWRSVKANGGYTLAVLPYGKKAPTDIKLVTKRPVRKIINLITGEEVSPNNFKLEDGPNLFRIELKN